MKKLLVIVALAALSACVKPGMEVDQPEFNTAVVVSWLIVAGLVI